MSSWRALTIDVRLTPDRRVRSFADLRDAGARIFAYVAWPPAFSARHAEAWAVQSA